MLARNTVGSLVVNGIIIWSGTSCPEGYSRFTAVDAKFIVGGAAYNAAAGGAATHTHTVPGHTHAISSPTTSAMPSEPGVAVSPPESPISQATSHTHTSSSGTSGSFSGTTDSQNNPPLYATVLLCQKS